MLQLTVLRTFKNGNFHKMKVVVSDMGCGLKSFVYLLLYHQELMIEMGVRVVWEYLVQA